MAGYGLRPVGQTLLLTVVLSLAACGSLPGRPAATPSATYVLQWNPRDKPSQTVRSSRCGTLLVSPPRAAPGYDTAAMAYVQRDFRLDYFSRNRWADSPARMLHPVLVAAMTHSRMFRNVLGEAGQVPAGLRLDSEILRLQQVFSAGHSSEQLRIRVELIDMRHDRLLLQRVFSVTEPAASNDPYGGVVAANRALRRLIDELTTAVAAVLATQPGECAPSRH